MQHSPSGPSRGPEGAGQTHPLCFYIQSSICSINSLIQYALGASYIPVTVLSARDTAVSK